MRPKFRKIARGPAWERWLIIEEQYGDPAFAGEIILTYTDSGVFADLQCDVLLSRELSEDEIEGFLDTLTSLLTGRGHVTIFTANEVVSQTFNMFEDEEEAESN